MRDKIHYKHEINLRNIIKTCNEHHHIQQVAFSVHHNALTQICFTCNAVRTTIPKGDIE